MWDILHAGITMSMSLSSARSVSKAVGAWVASWFMHKRYIYRGCEIVLGQVSYKSSVQPNSAYVNCVGIIHHEILESSQRSID